MNSFVYVKELEAVSSKVEKSQLYKSLYKNHAKSSDGEKYMNSLLPGYLAEKVLAYLFCEQNLISEVLLQRLVSDLRLNTKYLEKVLYENRHPVTFDQPYLL